MWTSVNTAPPNSSYLVALDRKYEQLYGNSLAAALNQELGNVVAKTFKAKSE